jgi:hypothetical protein
MCASIWTTKRVRQKVQSKWGTLIPFPIFPVVLAWLLATETTHFHSNSSPAHKNTGTRRIEIERMRPFPEKRASTWCASPLPLPFVVSGWPVVISFLSQQLLLRAANGLAPVWLASLSLVPPVNTITTNSRDAMSLLGMHTRHTRHATRATETLRRDGNVCIRLSPGHTAAASLLRICCSIWDCFESASCCCSRN